MSCVQLSFAIARARVCHSKNNKCHVWHACPMGTNCVPQRRETLLAEVIIIYSRISFASQNKFRENFSRKSFSFGKIFPRGLSASMHKLSPAAQKRGFACRRIFKKRAPEKVAQRVFREEEQRASEHSREERSGLQNLLRCDEAEGNPPRGTYWEAVIPLAPSLRELSSGARLRESPHYSLPCVRGGVLPKVRRRGC